MRDLSRCADQLRGLILVGSVRNVSTMSVAELQKRITALSPGKRRSVAKYVAHLQRQDSAARKGDVGQIAHIEAEEVYKNDPGVSCAGAALGSLAAFPAESRAGGA